MSTMSPPMEAALAGERAVVTAAIEIQFPNHAARLIVGSGFLTFPDGRRFEGRDDVIGVFSDIEDLTDGTGDEAPAVTISFITPSDTATAQLADVAMQGSKVKIWLVVVEPQTGQVIGDPQLLMNGLLDVATIRTSKTGRKVEYEVTSIFEDFFVADDGVRLSDGFHRYLWPGEDGLMFVTYVTHQIYFGTETPDGVTL